MNILLFELKSLSKSMLIWGFSLCITLVLFVEGFYPAFSDNSDVISQMIQGFPPELMSGFGMDLETIFSYEGFFVFTYMYTSIIGSIMATSYAVAVFGKEKRLKTSDFIFTKPAARPKIFCAKLTAVVLAIILSNVFYVAFSVYFFYDNNITEFAVLSSVSSMFTQFFFASMGIFIVAFLKKVRSVGGIATLVGFTAFISTALVDIIDKEFMVFLAPFKYFNPDALFTDGSYSMHLVIFSVGFCIVSLIYSYYIYTKKDIHSV